jgi:hypothetical protein
MEPVRQQTAQTAGMGAARDKPPVNKRCDGDPPQRSAAAVPVSKRVYRGAKTRSGSSHGYVAATDPLLRQPPRVRSSSRIFFASCSGQRTLGSASGVLAPWVSDI